jgi:predicted porin
MKKVLLASTALVGAAALFAAPAAADVSVSAFSQGHVSGGSDDLNTHDQDYQFVTNTEVHFNGSAETDNGLTFGFRVELEADSDTPAFVDENSVFFSGSFGKVEFGSNDGPEDGLHVSGSYVGVQAGGVGSPTFSVLSSYNTGDAPTTSDHTDSGDAVKISYWSPRFSGFQIGASFAPTTASDGDARGPHASTAGDLEDVFGFGLNFSDTINGISIDAGAVGSTGSAGTGGSDDLSAWGIGAMVGFSGFSIAAGYQQSDQDATADTESFDLGVGYTTGPWTIAIAGVHGEDDVSNDEFDYYSASIDYGLAQGLNIYATIGTGEVDDGGGSDNDFTVFNAGVKTSF